MPGGVIDWLIAPRATCQGCGSKQGTDEGWLCESCAKSLEPLYESGDAQARICRSCGEATRGGICPNCGIGHGVLMAVAAYEYGGAVRKMVENFKFRSVYRMDAWMAGEMEKALGSAGITDFDVITAVPLHVTRLVKRGYNQSEKLALKLSEKTGKPCETLLKRTRATRQQARLSADRRRQNLKGAFAPLHPMNGGTVLLIDDVRTTGSTLIECANTLSAAGADKVIALTFARA